METEQERANISPWREKRLRVPMELILFWGIWNLCVFSFFDSDSDDIVMMVLYGPCYGQPVLAALWGGWGAGRALVRWPVSLGLVVLQALCIETGEGLLDVLFALIVAYLSCIVLLLLGRWVTGWRIHHGEATEVSSANGQYGIRYLIGLTTFVALLAGLAKATDAVEWAQTGGLELHFVAMTVLFLLLFTTPVALLLIVMLMTGPHPMLRVLVVSMIGVVATLAIAVVMQHETGEFDVASLLQFGALMMGAGASVGLSAAALRWAGYRVGRKPGNRKVAAGGNLVTT